MLDSCIYSMLCVSDKKEVPWKRKNMQEIKAGLLHVVQHQCIDSLISDSNRGDALDFYTNLVGWN